jgi:predicted TIM-barrel fold metal-dependent hydrolase
MPERAATCAKIADVARRAGVSKTTVSRVIHPPVPVAEETACRCVYEKAAELRVPVLIHIGDPADSWKAEVTPDSLWYEILSQFRQWSYDGRPVPTRKESFQEQRSVLRRYPQTTFICLHVGDHAEDLEYLGALFEEHPNLHADTTAHEPVLGQAPDSARAFITKFQDRIVFGTDNGSVPLALETLAKRTRTKRLFYERDLEQGDLDDYLAPSPRKPGYVLRGINLAPSVLHKIYRENAARLIIGLASDPEPRHTRSIP